MKKLVALLLAVMMLSVSVMALAEVPEGYPEIVPEMIQAEPLTITIYDYWSGEGARAEEPTEEQQAQYDYRDWIEATYNVKVEQKQGGDWGTCAEEMINFTSAPDGSLRAYIIEPGKVGSLVANGVAASWGDYDFSAEKWNTFTLNAWKKGEEIYGVSTGATEPRGCVYFNKRILEEAGIDWNTIYDMQANGTWTWAAFEELLAKLHRDTDNDGIVDKYAMMSFSSHLLPAAVVSNGVGFVMVDENGKYYNAAESDAFLEAANWVMDMVKKYEMAAPEGAEWNYFESAFINGEVALQCHEEYFSGSLANMEDDYGIVPLPKYDENQENYAVHFQANVGASMSVPSGNTEVVKISKVLEDIAYESYLHVMPAYTEIVLEGQSVRDEESIVSLNIIRNSYYSDLGFMLGNYNIAILTQMRQVVTNNQDCASMLQKVMRVYTNALKKVQSPE